MTRLAPAASRAHLQDALDRLDVLLAHQDLGRAVSTCPGWDLRRLAGHLGQVHRRVIAAVETGAASRSAVPPTDDADLLAWLHAGGRALLGVLDRDPTHPAWSFDPRGGSVGFWQRRQLMENTVHRVDAESALDARTRVEPAVAADGVGEVLDTMLRLRVAERVVAPLAVVVRLRATDTGDVWTLGPDGAPADQAVGTAAAPAEALFLALWHRGDLDRLEVSGDVDAVHQVLALPLTP